MKFKIHKFDNLYLKYDRLVTFSEKFHALIILISRETKLIKIKKNFQMR